jgi:NAD(P)-dependent dehydrogenase (short-subunit alcohol dehydrogenase family)
MPTAVITGAGSGLGRAIAIDLAGRGFQVTAADVDAEAALLTAEEIGAGASATTLDVCDEAACRAAVDAVVGRSGGLDVWVNNAGVLHPGRTWEQPEPLRRTMIEVNTLGTMNGTVAALEAMIATRRGHVINVISLAGLVAPPGEVSYAASKHAALAFTLGTLFDLRGAGVDGVEVSALCPDGIWTPMLEDSLEDPDVAPSFSGRLLTAGQVAREVGRLIERPRPLAIVPRWRGPLLRLYGALPRFSLRLLPLLMWDARRRQRRYKRLIESGRWP